MEHDNDNENDAKFYTKAIVPKSSCWDVEIPDEWYEERAISDKFDRFQEAAFDANQFMRFFGHYTSKEWLSSVNRGVSSKVHHGLRKAIVAQTIHACRTGAYPSPLPLPSPETRELIVLNTQWIKEQLLKTTLYKSAVDLSSAPYPFPKTEISIVEGDCIEVAFGLIEQGLASSPVVLNMANASQPGGGYKAGHGAQEENLHRRSNYFQSLSDPDRIQGTTGGHYLYPIPDEGAIYSPNIVVFRASEAKGYAFLAEPKLMSFIACAAIAHPPLLYSKDIGYFMNEDSTELMKAKARTILSVVIANGHDSVVLSAFGCGAFKCPPLHVAAIFKEVCEEILTDATQTKGRLRHVAFGIFNDHNAGRAHNPQGNLKPFQDVFLHNVHVPIPSNK